MSTVRNELEGPYVVRTVIEWGLPKSEASMNYATDAIDAVAADLEENADVDSWQDRIDEAEHAERQARSKCAKREEERDEARDESANLRAALTAIVNRLRLAPSSRWPCPDCGRMNAQAPLRGLAVAALPYVSQTLTPVPASFKPTQFVGCWRCTSEDVIEAAAKAVGVTP